MPDRIPSVISLEEAIAEQQVDLSEYMELPSTLFSGIRTYVLNGIAHLLFYSERVNADGKVEHMVVARMVAPVLTARAACGRAAETMRLGRREGGDPGVGVRMN